MYETSGNGTRERPGGPAMRLVLASSSPRRRQLLAMVGAVFEVDPPATEEVVPPGLGPADVAVRLAAAKADEVASRHADALVIGADTVVAVDGDILGKPRDEEDARRMLRRLVGRAHEVWTGLALVHAAAGRRVQAAERTRVYFRAVDEAALERYVATGEGWDKAGAYAAQGMGALLVERVEGCFFNVVGLPLARLAALMEGFGVRWL